MHAHSAAVLNCRHSQAFRIKSHIFTANCLATAGDVLFLVACYDVYLPQCFITAKLLAVIMKLSEYIGKPAFNITRWQHPAM